MWMLNWLPDWVFHLVLLAGVLGLLASWVLQAIPFVKTYALSIQVIAIVLIVSGVWYEGGIAKDQQYRAEIAELKIKVAEAEAKSAVVNTEIETKVVTKTQIIKQKGDDIIKYIDREVTKYDNTCPIPEAVIKAHNAAALNKKVEEAK